MGKLTYTVKRETGNPFVYTITITASDYLPLEIFLFRHDIDNNDIFQHLCSIDELEKYDTDSNPLFRKKVLVMTGTSIVSLEQELAALHTAMTDLQIEYKAYLDEEEMDTTETVDIILS